MQAQSKESACTRYQISSNAPSNKRSVRSVNAKLNKKIEIGKYQFLPDNILGEGYTGIVYKANVKGNIKQRVAIKVIDLLKFNKPEDLALIEREIEIHKKLKHPNIINYLDIYKTEDKYHIVTEYCPHGDLNELLQTQKVLSEDVALKIMKQVIQAYKYLMSKNIIHRDLKPANIMRFGSTWKIGDFGFATYLTQDFVLDKINVGTPLYMPPQSLYYNKYSFKTDIFSIGIIFYEMLTGITPWPSHTEKELVETMEDQKLEIPDIIHDPTIRKFLIQTCHINYYSRMSKEELKKFSFEETQKMLSRSKSKKMNYTSKSLKKMILLTPKKSETKSKNSIVSPKNQKMVNFEYYGEQKKAKSEQLMKKVKENIEKIKNEEEFGNRIHFIIQNIKYLKSQKKYNDRLFVLFNKFLIRHMKMIANSKQNTLKLKDWDSTKKSTIFKSIQEQIHKKTTEIQTNYLQSEKSIPSDDIKHIRRLFPELSAEFHLNCGFYSNFANYIKQFVTMHWNETKKEIKYVIPLQFNVIKALERVYMIIKEKSKSDKFFIASRELIYGDDGVEWDEKAYGNLLDQFKSFFQ